MNECKTPRRTPLYDIHVAAGGRIVDFAGWDLPVQYNGILDEARAVRRHCGLFDVSHMGRFVVEGPGAANLLQRVTTNDVALLEDGRGQYSLLPNEAGGAIDDIIVYRRGPGLYQLVVNASNAETDLRWLREHSDSTTTVTDVSSETAMIAVQGPAAVGLVCGLATPEAAAIPRFGIGSASLGDMAVTLCRTGYTGEDGFEVICSATDAAAIWTLLSRQGACNCGLGARDVLRIEAGLPLYGHELTMDTSPVQAGLMWAVSLDKGPFVGRDAISTERAAGPSRRLVGIVSPGRIIPRQGYTLQASGAVVGTVTSGVFSPTRECGLGMAYVDAVHASSTTLDLEVRGACHPVSIVAKKRLLVP